jgi:hypothetical protein
MEIEGQLFLVVITVLAMTMVVIPTQWATFMKIIYSQKLAPRNNYIRAVGVIWMLVLWLIYNRMEA